jgi:hypothetical protein
MSLPLRHCARSLFLGAGMAISMGSKYSHARVSGQLRAILGSGSHEKNISVRHRFVRAEPTIDVSAHKYPPVSHNITFLLNRLVR